MTATRASTSPTATSVLPSPLPAVPKAPGSTPAQKAPPTLPASSASAEASPPPPPQFDFQSIDKLGVASVGEAVDVIGVVQSVSTLSHHLWTPGEPDISMRTITLCDDTWHSTELVVRGKLADSYDEARSPPTPCSPARWQLDCLSCTRRRRSNRFSCRPTCPTRRDCGCGGTSTVVRRSSHRKAWISHTSGDVRSSLWCSRSRLG